MPTNDDSGEGLPELTGSGTDDYEIGMTPARSATIAVIFSSGLTVGVTVGLEANGAYGALAAVGAMAMTVAVLAVTHRWRWLRRRLMRFMVWLTRL
jgi:peptidoglycan/LPS O-acetylase OafA/YrhL